MLRAALCRSRLLPRIPTRCDASQQLRSRSSVIGKTCLRAPRSRLFCSSSPNSAVNIEDRKDDDSSFQTTEAWDRKDAEDNSKETTSEHAVLSTFDLFSIGIGPSSSVRGSLFCSLLRLLC